MPDAVPVANLAKLPPERFAPLRDVLAHHTSMQRALAWFFTSNPPLAPDDLIAQDEFSYDLLVPHPDGVWLGYDTN